METENLSIDAKLKTDAIENLIDQAKNSEGVSREFMQPKTSQKKKGGRPRINPDDPKWSKPTETPKTLPETPLEPVADFKPACTQLFQVLNGVWVAWAGFKELEVKESEIVALGTAWGEVCNRRLPSVLVEYSDLINAGAVTGAVAIRLSAAVKELKKEVKAKKDAEARLRENESNPPIN